MEEPAVKEEFVAGSDRLFVMFGGINGKMGGIPPFEFYRVAGVLDCSKIFIRDPYQAWYQRGLPGIGDDLDAVKEFLEERITASGASDVRFVGNSMGGFAAILFSAMTGRGRAVAFAPQTFIDKKKRKKFGDRRWSDQLADMYAHEKKRHIYDLGDWLPKHASRVDADVYVSDEHPLDMAHADNVADVPGIHIHRYDLGGHRLVKHLRDSGELIEILNR